MTKLFTQIWLPAGCSESAGLLPKPNRVFTFVPFLLMGESDSTGDITAALLKERESIYLHHLWATFTGDEQAAPFSAWAPYVAAMARPGIARSSSYYRAV